MSAEAVKEFFDRMAQDEALRDEVIAAVKQADDRNSVTSEIAAKHGFQFTAEELAKILDATQGADKDELTPEELEAVAAGLLVFQQIKFAPPYVPVGPNQLGNINTLMG